MEPEITLYSPQFRDQILELTKDLWSTDPALNSAYLAWKYESNPHVEAPLLYLALERGRVIGMRGAYGMAWERSDTEERLPALGMGDLVIAADRRGRGVFYPINRWALRDLRARGYRFVLSLSANPATYIQCVRSGWRDVGSFAAVSNAGGRERLARRAYAYLQRFPALRKPHSSVRRWGRLALVIAGARGAPFAHLDRSNPPAQSRSSFRIAIEREPRPEAMAELNQRAGAAARLRHRRDKAHIAWRYRNPLCQYRFLFLEKDAHLQAYLVLQAPLSARGSVVKIVDWEGADSGLEEVLLQQAQRLGRLHAMHTWSATLSPDRAAILARSGFRAMEEQRDRRQGLLIRSLDHDSAQSKWAFAGLDLTDLQSWDLRMIDSDGH